jgi:hypothetical protein
MLRDGHTAAAGYALATRLLDGRQSVFGGGGGGLEADLWAMRKPSGVPSVPSRPVPLPGYPTYTKDVRDLGPRRP